MAWKCVAGFTFVSFVIYELERIAICFPLFRVRNSRRGGMVKIQSTEINIMKQKNWRIVIALLCFFTAKIICIKWIVKCEPNELFQCRSTIEGRCWQAKYKNVDCVFQSLPKLIIFSFLLPNWLGLIMIFKKIFLLY